jgi:hypothetical protein
MTISESREWRAKNGYNRVIASGTNTGYTVTCTLDGTDGAKLAPVIVHPLILTPQVGRNAGRYFLYENGSNQLARTREFPLHSVDYPLLPPGTVVKNAENGWFSIVERTRVTLTRPHIHQSVTMLEYK